MSKGRRLTFGHFARKEDQTHQEAFMSWKTIDDLALAGKTVLTRVDINVPMDGDVVTDTTRIDKIRPTVEDIIAHGGKVVLLAHFGRPKGKVVPEMSLRRVQPALEASLGRKIVFVERPSRSVIDSLPFDSVVLVENTRFTPMEEANDPAMAQFLASLGDVFCNDAFSAAHRAHASTEGIAHLLPSFAGRLMEEELRALEAALGNPQRPVVAVVGGAKVSTKLELLGNLVSKVDHLVIGGGMANTFLVAQGIDVGKSLAERDLIDTAQRIMQQAEDAKCAIILPIDGIVAKEFKAGAQSHDYGVDAIPADGMILDVGPMSVDRVRSAIDDAHTIVWNGPLGAFEIAPFDQATVAVAKHAAARTKANKLVSVAGGGDTVAALNHAGVAQDFTYISTAGGAFLEWLEGKPLPGVKALEVRT
jgi:phosphoglycerate kinase